MPVVVVANYPLQYFTQRLTTGMMDIRFPAAVSNDPAYWRPSAEDVAELQKADLIVLNGASYEQWTKNVSLPSSKVIETAEAFKDQWIPLDGAVSHSHGLEGEHEHAGTAFTTWLDMNLAREQARAIRDALIARWPSETSLFEDNFAKLESDLMALDEQLYQVVSQSPSTAVVFSHPVYQYLQARYDLEGSSVHWEVDEMPTDDEWSALASRMLSKDAQWMVWEGEPDEEIARRLNTIGMKGIVFDPCDNTPANGDFFTVMNRNVESLRTAFGSN
jgi:zinc transport system substrate-binding protein